jgi:hypothetical protein
MQWTPLDLKNLAAIYDDMANAVLNYRIQNGMKLDQPSRDQLTTIAGKLMSYGDEFENAALAGALQNVGIAVTDLQTAAHDATDALKNITNLQKAITIAIAAVGVGAAFFDPNPATIAGSVSTLVQAVAQPTPVAAPATPAPANASPVAAGGVNVN